MTTPRIGVIFRPQFAPERLRDFVLRAEDAGVDDVWLWEDCFAEGGLTTATAALAWTDRLRVGVGLLPVPLRNPALAAMEIATVARLFPGRFVPGVGHGVLDWMAQVGARAASPVTLLREWTGAVRALLHGESVTVRGEYVKLDDVRLEWPPEVVPPLLVGARGPRTLAAAGEVADGVVIDGGPTPERLARSLDQVAAGAVGSPAPDRPREVVVYLPTFPDEYSTLRYGADPDRPLPDYAGAVRPGGAHLTICLQPAGDGDPAELIAQAARARAALG